MKIASHNSFTYLRPRRWYMRPFASMARCQRVDVIQQYNLGARLFDLRVRFYNGSVCFCHGLMEYKHARGILDYLDDVCNPAGRPTYVGFEVEPVYVRVVLEKKKPTEADIHIFAAWCGLIEELYPNIRFFGGNDRSDWDCKHPHYNFKTPLQDLDDKYSSTTTLFPKGLKWLRFLDDLCPVLYARLHNRRNVERGTSHEWLFIDFVDIQ